MDILTEYSQIGGYSYLDNPQYDAYVTTFELSNVQRADVVFCGDSITARGLFGEFFERKTVVNRGIGSDTSEGIYNRLDQIIELSPSKIFIMIGINDIGKNIPISDTADNMNKICTKIHSELPNTEIYIQSVLPNENKSYSDEITNLNASYKSLCNDNGFTFVNLYPEFIDGSSINEDLYCDGTHINGAGYKIWIDSIKQYINE